jgi:hypothetical protein
MQSGPALAKPAPLFLADKQTGQVQDKQTGQVQLRDEQTGLSTHIPAAAQKIFPKNPPISKNTSFSFTSPL